MPAFSPDGTMLAAVRSPSSSDNVLPNDPTAIVYLPELLREHADVRRHAERCGPGD
jgi:hypothetical protein